jgi:hypothetical protein
MSREIKLKRGEGKTLTFTIKNRRTGAVIPVTTATQTFTVSSVYGGTPLIQKNDSDFTKTYAADGIVSVDLYINDTDITPYEYIAELKTHFSNSMSDKSRTIKFIISTAVE